MSQQQIANCLRHGELVSVMQRMCPPEVYWLFEFLFPSTSIRMSDDGVFNLLQLIEQTIGPAQFANLCAIKGNVVATGASVNLETVTAPRIFEEGHLGVCDTDGLIINPNTGREFASWQEKLDYAQANKAMLFTKRLRKRLALMSSELLVHGKMIIDGENIERFEIDFGRNPDNTVMIDAADKWTEADADPLEMLDAIVAEVFECETEGLVDVLLSQKAWSAFRNHSKIKELLKLQGDSKCIDCQLRMELFPKGTRVLGQRLVASLDAYNFWLVGKHVVGYENMDANDVYLVIRDAFKPIRGYGAIKDMFGLHRETAYFSQEVKRHGIKQEFESRPLPIPGNINATAVLKGVV